MSRHRFNPSAALVALAAALVLALAGCGGGDDQDAGSGGGTETTAAAGGGEYAAPSTEATETTDGGAAGGGSGEATLTAQDDQWTESSLTLPAGTTTLKVVNNDGSLHSFTARQIDVDEDIEGGSTVDIQLDLTGVSGPVEFFCKYHSGMSGQIEVG